ncbi:L-threonylcarbamoyladenylate synthase [Paenibacillus sp. J2TS4]|uniref:L-threonylcarbamoyladenylate synthase n=1 Tax=Paenibacillus sp. J2TS4 TaxID=2807194 RepID=UPI001B17ABDE|nr:L-threonylcarbamoyladenylate synthase [Paenibacillus sp. J2TS4]GIP35536.1 threonylcarbamoyl-AMP synthase [Paenibacillus sp. J2TS4]
MTKVWTVNPQQVEAADSELQEAARLIREGKRVAFPTETVYGLGADARNAEAIAGIFTAKGRPADNPLIVHLAHRSQISDLTDRLDETSCRLMDAFWPGPLTLVLPAKPGAVAASVTAGLPTVAVRVPDHPVALRLIEAAGCPVAAPSANRSGRPSPTRAAHVLADLDGRIDGIVDGGPTGVGVESTVVEVVDGVVHVLRPGGVSAEQLRRVASRVLVRGELSAARSGSGDSAQQSASEWQAEEEAPPKSPGMKYTHYAPQGRLTVVSGEAADRISAWISGELRRAKEKGERTGVLTFDEHRTLYSSKADVIVSVGSIHSPESMARHLYDSLRSFDEEKVTVIFAEAIEEQGIGLAVMNRLLKAAGNRVMFV